MTKRSTVRVRDVMRDQFVLMDGISTVAEGITALSREGAHTLFIRRRTSDDEFGIVALADVDTVPDQRAFGEVPRSSLADHATALEPSGAPVLRPCPQ